MIQRQHNNPLRLFTQEPLMIQGVIRRDASAAPSSSRELDPTQVSILHTSASSGGGALTPFIFGFLTAYAVGSRLHMTWGSFFCLFVAGVLLAGIRRKAA